MTKQDKSSENTHNPTLKQLPETNYVSYVIYFPPIALASLSSKSKQTTSASQCGLRPTLTHVLYPSLITHRACFSKQTGDWFLPTLGIQKHSVLRQMRLKGLL